MRQLFDDSKGTDVWRPQHPAAVPAHPGRLTKPSGSSLSARPCSSPSTGIGSRNRRRAFDLCNLRLLAGGQPSWHRRNKSQYSGDLNLRFPPATRRHLVAQK